MYQHQTKRKLQAQQDPSNFEELDGVQLIRVDKDVAKALKERYGNENEDSYSDIIRKLIDVVEGRRRRSTVLGPKLMNRMSYKNNPLIDDS
jgi:predicted CopG family antitoxin